jgi:hypothetical protein
MIFNILAGRLREIDASINRLIFQLVGDAIIPDIESYCNHFVGRLEYRPERDTWLQDFLMAIVIDLVKASASGVVPLMNAIEPGTGLRDQLIFTLQAKFKRDGTTIQPLIDDLERLLGTSVDRWLSEHFFFYHCDRFGGRPIIWQITSNPEVPRDAALNAFIDFHRIDAMLLPALREQHAGLAGNPSTTSELLAFDDACRAIEHGFPVIPRPNVLAGFKATDGKGLDKTWDWVFKEAATLIQDGYRPDLSKGVLVNLIPLCLALPDNAIANGTRDLPTICPNGTIVAILKKIDALDQLKQVPVDKDNDEPSGILGTSDFDETPGE